MRQFTRSSDIAAVVLAFALAGCEAETPSRAESTGDPDKGRTVIAGVGCGVCHEIPGVSGASGIVGPSLRRFSGRTLIGGVHVNEPQVLVSWLRDAPELSPGTGMPEMPISEQEARDAAAYLYTLR
ncbi:MAG TPA: cytochrome c class I [Aestuariivirgaceae bacterium]|nr:cytochrome c class I [Aestuariivirgaceae bacterium]